MKLCSIWLFMITDKGQMYTTIFLSYEQSFKTFKTQKEGMLSTLQRTIHLFLTESTGPRLTCARPHHHISHLAATEVVAQWRSEADEACTTTSLLPLYTRQNGCYCPLTRNQHSCHHSNSTRGVVAEPWNVIKLKLWVCKWASTVQQNFSLSSVKWDCK